MKVEWLVPLKVHAVAHIWVEEDTPKSVVEEIAEDQVSLAWRAGGTSYFEMEYTEVAYEAVRAEEGEQ